MMFAVDGLRGSGWILVDLMRFKTSEWLCFPNGGCSRSEEWPGLTCAPTHMRQDAVAQLFLSNLSDLSDLLCSSSSMVKIYCPIGTSARYQRTWRPCYVVNTRTWANTFHKFDTLQELASKLSFEASNFLCLLLPAESECQCQTPTEPRQGLHAAHSSPHHVDTWSQWCRW